MNHHLPFVNPVTPTAFETTRISTTITLNSQKTNDGNIQINVELDRKILLGFVAMILTTSR